MCFIRFNAGCWLEVCVRGCDGSSRVRMDVMVVESCGRLQYLKKFLVPAYANNSGMTGIDWDPNVDTLIIACFNISR